MIPVPRFICAGSIAAFLVGAVAVPPKAEAVDFYWKGTTSSTWGVNSNWTNTLGSTTDASSAPGSISDRVFFNNSVGVTQQIATLGANRSIGSVTFNSASPITLAAGGAFSLILNGSSGAGITVTNTSAAHTISAPISIVQSTGTQTWTSDSSNVLTLGGLVTHSLGNLIFAGTGTGGFKFTGGLSINGNLTWTNNNTAAAVLSTGPLSVSTATFAGAGGFSFSGKTTGSASSTTINISGTGARTFGDIDIVPTADASTTARTLTFSIGSGSTTTVTGVVANGNTASAAAAANGLTKSGAGTLNLTGTTTFTGALVINEGKLTMGTAGTPSNTATTTSSTGGGGVGTNTITLASVSGIAVGQFITGTNVPAGAVVTAFNPSTNTVTISTNFTTAVTNGTGISFGGFNNSMTFGAAAAPNGSTPTLTLNSDRFFGAGTITVGGNLNIGTSTIDGAGKLLLTNTLTLQVNQTVADDDLVIKNIIANDTTAARTLQKNGSGTLVLEGANTFTGNLNVGGGIVKIRATNQAAGGLAFNSGTALILENNSSYLLAGTLSVNPATTGTAVMITGTSGGEQIRMNSGTTVVTRTFRIQDNTSTDADTIISVPIVNGTGPANFYKDGTGKLLLTGANTYTGTTTVFRGSLVLDYSTSAAGKMSDTADLEMRGGTLTLEGSPTGAVSELVGKLSPGGGSQAGGSLTGTAVSLGGASTIVLHSNNNQPLSLTFSGFNRNPAGGIVSLVKGTGIEDFRTTAGNDAAGLLSTSVLMGGRWIKNDGTGKIVQATGTVQNNMSLWNTTQNVEVTQAASGSLVVDRVGALTFANTQPVTIALNGAGSRNQSLTLTDGAILMAPESSADVEITGGKLMTELPYVTAGGADILLINNSLTGATLKISANLGHNDTPLGSAQQITIAGNGVGWVELAGKSTSIPTYNSSTIIRGAVNILGGGQLRVSGGDAISDFLPINMGAIGDSAGKLDLAGSKETIGGILNVDASQGSSGGVIMLGTNGELTLNQTLAATWAGSLTGTGKLTKAGGATLTLTNNTGELNYTGSLNITGGAVALGGVGVGFTNLTDVNISGGEIQANFENVVVNGITTPIPTVNKFGANTTFHLNGTTGNGIRVALTTNVPDPGILEETLALDLASGANTITVDAPSSTSKLTLNFTQSTNGLTRSKNSTLLVRGDVLGTGAASKVTFNSDLTSFLKGTSGITSGTNIPIVPWAIGTMAANDPNGTGVGDTFVTYGANGFQPLTASQYAPFVPATASTDNNVKVTASATSTTTSNTVNSLLFDTSANAITLTGSGTLPTNQLIVSSGGILVSAGASTNGATINYPRLTTGTGANSSNELVVHVTSSAANPADAKLTILSTIADNANGAVALTKSGAGTLVLNPTAGTGSNSFSGGLTINQGTVDFTGANSLGANGTVIRLAGGTLKWNDTTDVTFGHTIELVGPNSYYTPTGTGVAGNGLARGNTFDIGTNNVYLQNGTLGNANSTGGIVKVGSGTLTLKFSPNYKGSTVVTEGNMDFESGIAANTTSGLFLIPENKIVNGTVDVNGVSTPVPLPVGMPPTGTGNSGVVNSTVTGNLNVQQVIIAGMFLNQITTGTTANFAAPNSATLTTQRNGSNTSAVHIGDGGGDSYLIIGYRDEGAAGGAGLATGVTNPSVVVVSNPILTGTADFTNSTSVDINVSRILLGQNKGSGSGRTDGNLYLAGGSTTVNNVTTGYLVVGNSPGANNTGEGGNISLMKLGSGTNNLNVDTMIVGGLNSNGRVELDSGGTLKLRDRAGTGGANLFIGDNDDVTNTTQNGLVTEMALAAGTVDMKINSLVIGRHGANSSATTTAGGGQGTLSFSDGTVEASTVQLAVINTRGVTLNPFLTTGAITMDGGNFLFGTMSQGAGIAQFNWNGGTLGNIPGRDAVNQNLRITVNSSNLHNISVDAGQTMTFGPASSFNSTGDIHKIGSGSLILQGDSGTTDAYGGAVFVDQGRLIVTNSTGSATGNLAVIVANGAELLGTGSVGGIAIIEGGGKLSPGLAGSTTLSQLRFADLELDPNSTLKLDFQSGGLEPNIEKLLLSGTLDMTGADDLATAVNLELTDVNAYLLLSGALPFITYTNGFNPGLFKVNGKLMLDYQAGVTQIQDAFWIGQNGYWIDYNYSGGTQVALIAVPEPGALASLLGGMGMLVGLQRFRRWGSSKR